MVIIADQRIPGIELRFPDSFEVRLLPGHAIDSSCLKDADALFVRSVTAVDRQLLDGTRVGFVGSATAGIDHIDVDGLSGLDVTVSHAAGCNAPAVCDYILTALFEIGSRLDVDPFGLTVGIIGAGNVGSMLEQQLEVLGIKTIVNDPPLEAILKDGDKPSRFVPLDELLGRADVVTLHVPLSDHGPHPTHDLLGSNEIARLKSGSWLLNTSRGFIVDESALLLGLESGKIAAAVVDTWQDEPRPDRNLVRSATFSTPHVAGYAIESKARATAMVLDAFSAWADVPLAPGPAEGSRSLPLAVPPPDMEDAEFCVAVIRQAYDINRDHLRMQAMCSFEGEKQEAFFRELRDNYRLRNEFGKFTAMSDRLSSRQKSLLDGLRMQVESA